MTTTMTDAMQVLNHSFEYAHRQIKRDTMYGETMSLYDTTEETCKKYAFWVLENYPDGACDHSIKFWSWLNER